MKSISLKENISLNRRVLFVASFGGHWIQLNKIICHFDLKNSFLSSTDVNAIDLVKKKLPVKSEYLLLEDVNKSNLSGVFGNLFRCFRFIGKHKIDVVVSTGALPGLICCFSAFVLRRKTIWIDSLANVKRLSLSGKVAKLFCTIVLTQWPHLEKGSIKYRGRVL